MDDQQDVRHEEEKRLIEAFKQGDRSAFVELIRLYERQLINFAYRKTGNREEAQDVVQNTLIRAYQSLDRFRGDSIAPWMFRIATNICNDYYRLRHQNVSLDVCVDISDTTKTSPEETALENDRVRSLHECIKQLSEPYRTAIILRYFEGANYTEIAAKMNTNTITVTNWLYRGRQKIRKCMEEKTEDA